MVVEIVVGSSISPLSSSISAAFDLYFIGLFEFLLNICVVDAGSSVVVVVVEVVVAVVVVVGVVDVEIFSSSSTSFEVSCSFLKIKKFFYNI